ncbi:M23 family metallopeptidase [Vibrio japonicus]|uniref:M23 family metallopeptidase n=1 Tax=Vibrio japonicus TaxID=1824638 RepID=A0ABY5LK60_9VIBR|nr:M23 family metallopeptidase [Vibrio japonicus]UUM32444.1 M23 family metallopeptidase [Vibrio japonicus]
MTSIALKQHTPIVAIPLAIILLVIIAINSIPHLLTVDESPPSVEAPSVAYSDIEQIYQSHFRRNAITTGNIDYSFVASLMNSGLSQREIKPLLSLIESRFDIIGDVSNGDKFSAKTQFNKNNERYISAFYYSGKNKDFFVMNDGNRHAYDQYGVKLTRKPYFDSPLDVEAVVSSSFDLKRKHPVTHLVVPHFGTDFAIPVGTDIRSIADGVVEKSRYNRFAGHYINIRHSNGTLSRYLHLSKRHVRVGERVTKGQIIGKSGNSGRTTGPHLHIELLVDGTPVDYEQYVQEDASPIVNPRMLVAAHLEHTALVKALDAPASL